MFLLAVRHGDEEIAASLPTEVKVRFNRENPTDKVLITDVIDGLSDQYGWCVNNSSFEDAQ